MVKCNNCGAEYDDEDDICPYCGSDNFECAEKKYRGKLEKLNSEKAFWRYLPERAAGKGKKFTVYFFAVLIILTVVTAGITYSISVIKQKEDYRKTKDNVAKMEEMYKNGDYTGIYEYMSKLTDRSKKEYDKFYNIYRLQQYVVYATDMSRDYDDGYIRWLVENNRKDSFYDISYIVWIFNVCKEAENNYYMYGEEAAIEYYRDYSYSYIEEEYGIGREELNQIIEEAGGLTHDNEDKLSECISERAFAKLAEKYDIKVQGE